MIPSLAIRPYEYVETDHTRPSRISYMITIKYNKKNSVHI